jgi:hypothetical protein
LLHLCRRQVLLYLSQLRRMHPLAFSEVHAKSSVWSTLWHLASLQDHRLRDRDLSSLAWSVRLSLSFPQLMVIVGAMAIHKVLSG